MGQHSLASLPSLRKPTHVTPLYFELGLGVFMKVVGKDVNFHFPLI